MGQDSKLYQLKSSNGQTSLTSQVALPNNTQVLDIANDGELLAVLMKANTSETYRLGLLLAGQPQIKPIVPINTAGSGQKPTLIAVQGLDVYVVLASAPATNSAQSAQIIDVSFMRDANGNLTQKASSTTSLSLSTNIVSIAAFPGHLLVLLLANGAVQSLKVSSPPTNPPPVPTPVLVQPPIMPSLAINASDATSTTPVPTVPPMTQTGPSALRTSGPGILSAGAEGTPSLHRRYCQPPHA